MSDAGSHPSAFRLEALHAGEADAEAAAHVERCAACRAYLDGLDAERAAHQAAPMPAFLEAPANVVPFPARRSRLVYILPALAAAAALALVLLRPGADGPPPDEIRMKGAVGVVAIRDRDGAQVRERGRVLVRPGDRLRFEVTVPAAKSLSVVARPDDGPAEVLVSGARLEAGVHLLEPTLRADEEATRVTIWVGPPALVEPPAVPRDGPSVTSLRIESESP